MKRILLTLTIITIVNIVHAQDNWITYKIDDKLSVKLPTQPIKIKRGAMAYTKDSLSYFVGIIAETDSVSLEKIASTDNFVNGLKKAMIGDQKDINLDAVKPGKWKGHYCYNVDGVNTSNKLKVSFYFVVIGGKIYVLSAMMPDSHNINEKNIFFNSLTFN